jgi:signal transduction histidine kinase
MAPQKVRFRYKLEGRDASWQDPGIRRQAFYTDLPPGKYTFRVIACNNDGVWNEEGATFNFAVSPAWYQTNRFLVLCLFTTILIFWALYRLRVRQVARTIGARFDERLAERTRLAREIHDTLVQTIQGSKMVADDALDEATDFPRMRQAMERLSVWLGQATEEGRAALNSLRTSTTQTNDLAESFRRALNECRNQGFPDTVFVAEGKATEMHPIVRDEIYRIGYEAIRNACQHAEATRLEVHISYSRDFSLRIADDGKGIVPAVVAQGKDGHYGLQGMRERSVRIGGKLSLKTSANAGTNIELIVPGRIVFLAQRSGWLTPLTRIKGIFHGPDVTNDMS